MRTGRAAIGLFAFGGLLLFCGSEALVFFPAARAFLRVISALAVSHRIQSSPICRSVARNLVLQRLREKSELRSDSALCS
jgi:hypothetical protein